MDGFNFKTLVMMPTDPRITFLVALVINTTSDASISDCLGVLNDRYPFLVIFPCGERFLVHSVLELPYVACPCPCGNPQHWFTMYDFELEV